MRAHLLVLLIFLAAAGCTTHRGEKTQRRSQSGPDPDQAIAAIRELGGKPSTAQVKGQTVVVAVDLEGSPTRDADLEHLESLADLQVLDLAGTRVGDDGLVHLRGLTELKTLALRNTGVSDKGLA